MLGRRRRRRHNEIMKVRISFDRSRVHHSVRRQDSLGNARSLLDTHQDLRCGVLNLPNSIKLVVAWDPNSTQFPFLASAKLPRLLQWQQGNPGVSGYRYRWRWHGPFHSADGISVHSSKGLALSVSLRLSNATEFPVIFICSSNDHHPIPRPIKAVIVAIASSC